jgi:hypothetical protein
MTKGFFMKNKKMILWIALLVMAIIPVYAQQYDSEKDFQVDWDDGGGVKITKYIGLKKEVSIPPNIQNNPVTSIGGFNDKTNITKVTIPNSVTNIGSKAFADCTGLTNINIPNSVTSIGSKAFANCTGLTNINIPNSVNSIGNEAFSRCSKLTNVIIPDSVTSIGYEAFADCTNLTNIIIPDNVTSMGGGAFLNCSKLAKVTIGNGVKRIEHSDKYGSTDLFQGAFQNCTSLTSVTIGSSVASIGWNAFRGCNKLTNIIIPNSVTNIDHYAFRGCTSLTSIIIPDSVTIIGSQVFGDCTSLTSVTFQGTIPSNNIRGGHYDMVSPFPGDLRDKYIANDGGPGVYNRFAGGETWRKTQSITSPQKSSVATPAAATSDASDTGTPGLNYTLINNNKEYAVSQGTVKQGAVVIPATYNNLPVTMIQNEGFKDNKSITFLIIPDSVERIGNNAFSNCSGLTNVRIGLGVTRIGNSAFWNCTGLTSIVIGNSVTYIGDLAFSKTSLTYLIFLPGSNITDANFGNNAFPEGSDKDGGNTLKIAYSTGKAGTYLRQADGKTWIKR